jgi:hypothetical protein
MIACYFTTLFLLSAFDPPEPANPLPADDLLSQALTEPMPDDRYGLLTTDDARMFELINFFPKKTSGISQIKHQLSLNLGSANLHLGDGTVQDLLEVPAWMHLLRYDYRNVPLPDDLAHEYQNIMGVIALSEPTGSHVAIDGRNDHRADRIPDSADLNANNTKLDIHIEDSSSRDYKLSGIVSTAFGYIHDPVDLKWDDTNDLGGTVHWIKTFPGLMQLDAQGSFTYQEMRKAGVLTQSGNNTQLKAMLISTLTDWAFSMGSVAWFSSLPTVRSRLLPQCEISWRVSRLTAMSVYFGGYFDDKSVGSELVERPYARMGDKLATNEKRRAMWEGWHSIGGWVLFSFAGGYREDRLVYQWIAANGFVSPKPVGRMRAWVADPGLVFTPTQSTRLNLSLDLKSEFPGEEVNFSPRQIVTAEFAQKITPQLEATVGEHYHSSMPTGDTNMPELPSRWDSYAGVTWDFTRGVKLMMVGENLTNNIWSEIPGRRGAGVTVRSSVYAAF